MAIPVSGVPLTSCTLQKTVPLRELKVLFAGEAGTALLSKAKAAGGQNWSAAKRVKSKAGFLTRGSPIRIIDTLYRPMTNQIPISGYHFETFL